MRSRLLHPFPGRSRRRRWTVLSLVVLALCAQWFLPASATTPLSVAPLLQKASLVYEGAFRVPQLPNGGFGAAYGFDYATTGIAYNPEHNSLFVNNHIYEQKTAELGIPAISRDMTNLAIAPVLQGFSDLSEGHLQNTGPGGTVLPYQTIVGGLMVFGNRLIGTSYIFYDALHEATRSHFTSSLDLSQAGDFRGLYRVGGLNPGFYNGYMAPIPPEWQVSLGGPALTGNCCLSVIGRTSFGPSAYVFNPDDLGVIDPLPAVPLVYYSEQHPTLGRWDNQAEVNLNFNMGSAVRGAVFPAGSRTLLFFGRQGLGIPCYGEGGATAPPDAVHWCFDPVISAKGNHAWPYAYWVWAYDANDLQAVKNGEKNPWDIAPYSVFSLDLPIDTFTGDLQGVTYDAASQRIYVSQLGGDGRLPYSSPFNMAPLIHVFHVDLNGGTGSSDPPMIGYVPPNPVIPQTTPDGAPYSFAVTATTVDGVVVAACNPASASMFPIGTTTVVCTATDHLGRSTSKSFTVTVVGPDGGGSPIVDAPSVMSIREATSPAGATVTFTAPAWHNSTTTGATTCAPASGSTFAIGRTVVTCSATAGGSTASVSFDVIVADTTKPTTAIASPVSGVYLTGTRVPVNYSCGDSASGVKLCQGNVNNGAMLDTTRTGTFTFTVVASDNASNITVANVSYTVLNETPLTWPTPADLNYGTPLGAAQLNASTQVPGTFIYTPPVGTLLTAGLGQELWVTFFPTDSEHYAPAAGMVRINVRQRIAVTAPNTTATWTWGTVRPITWTHGGGAGALFNIDVSRDSGVTWTPVATGVPAAAASTGAFNWPVNGPATTHARIRVRALADGASDISDVDFTIVPGALTVTSPNGSGTLRIGETRAITFTHNLGVGAPVTIEITRDGGASWSTVAATTTTSATSSSYPWTVSGPATTRARIRVAWAPTVADISDFDFTISPPVVTVTSPNGAGTVRIGDPQTILFTHNLGLGQTINLDVSGDGGDTWSPIGSVVTTSTTSGSYTWIVGGPVTTRARVRASWAADPGVADMSDVNFAITDTATVNGKKK